MSLLTRPSPQDQRAGGSKRPSPTALRRHSKTGGGGETTAQCLALNCCVGAALLTAGMCQSGLPPGANSGRCAHRVISPAAGPQSLFTWGGISCDASYCRCRESVLGKALCQLLIMRGNATSASNRTVLRPSAASNTIRARFTSRRAVVGARQRASSIFRTFGLSRTSCFGNHPDLESRLPYEEKSTVSGLGFPANSKLATAKTKRERLQ